MARGFQGRPQRMAKHWDEIGAATVAFGGSSTILTAALAFDEAWTVIRLLGEYSVGPGVAPVAGDQVAIGVGIGVVSSDAVAAGAGSMPDPVLEPGYPWLYWADHRLSFSSTSVDPSSNSASLRRAFDVKSMRKIKPRESLVLVAEYLNIVGDPPINFLAGKTRVLVAR